MPATIAFRQKRAPTRNLLACLPQEVSDRLVMLAVENELFRSEAVNGHLFDVKVADGIVTLSGRVNHVLAKQIAVGLAMRVLGVLW